ncbi:MAG: DUF6293 family protein [Desulfurococcaceae archaeon]
MKGIVLLGFDVSHVMRTIQMYKLSDVVVIVSSIKGRIDQRVSLARSMLSQYAKLLNVNYYEYEVEITDLYEAVNDIKDIINRFASGSELVIDASGGPRLLVIETILAYLSLLDELGENTKLIIYVEGATDYVEIDYETLIKLLERGIELRKLGNLEREILISMKPNIEYRLNEIHEILSKKGYNYKKQYTYKLMRNLERKGLIERVGRGVYVKRPWHYI